MEKLGNFVSPEKWEPCYKIVSTVSDISYSRGEPNFFLSVEKSYFSYCWFLAKSSCVDITGSRKWVELGQHT